MRVTSNKFPTIKGKLLSRWLRRSKKPRLQYSEGGVVEDPNKPYITIDGVQIFVEDLPEEGQGIFGRLQRLNQKKVNITLDLEEVQAGINFFSNKIVDIVNNDGQDTAADAEVVEELSESSDSD
tara:strand:+ start:89 stop:460 length:372 start_codon:yes stop_codon:yes gene_type:complete